jgi:hypothetical protein
MIKLAGAAFGTTRFAEAETVRLFDGKTLDGWIQIENAATSIASGSVADPAALIARLNGKDALASYLRGRLKSGVPADPGDKTAYSAMTRELNDAIQGPSIYDQARFAGVTLRPETARLLSRNPSGFETARLNKMLLEDAWPNEIAKSALTGWVVKDGAMASTGSGRGVTYTARDFNRFKLQFTMRHVSGNPDHQACVLIFCSRPGSLKEPGEKPLDALGGIQFQVPNGGHWDYRVGMNNNGGAEFTTITKTHFDPREWSRVEIEADASSGTARMKVAQPVGSEPVAVLEFKDPAAGKSGPIAWQMHNAGLFEEFKDVTIDI